MQSQGTFCGKERGGKVTVREGPVMREAEVSVTLLLEWSHEPKDAGSLKKPEKAKKQTYP